MTAALTLCNACRFWHNAERRSGVCRRHAPAAGDRPFQVARWPETRVMDGCGEGVEETQTDGPERQLCGACVFWDRPGIGIDPAQRGDRMQAWWQNAGWCRRYAPRPGVEIGEHAFWRATHAEDFCYEGRPRPGR